MAKKSVKRTKKSSAKKHVAKKAKAASRRTSRTPDIPAKQGFVSERVATAGRRWNINSSRGNQAIPPARPALAWGSGGTFASTPR